MEDDWREGAPGAENLTQDSCFTAGVCPKLLALQ